MRFRLPTPLHGWREFFGEITIIVIGVLIALAAGQIVEGVHWRNEVIEFRQAADRELGYDVAAYAYRLRQGSCVSRRIADLKRWADSQQRGAVQPFAAEIDRPSVLIFRSSVWSARSPDVMSHMPLDRRIAYASLYDRLASFQAQVIDEREAWRSLAAYNGAPRLSGETVMRLNELLYRAGSINDIMRRSAGPIADDLKVLGIRPRIDRRQAMPPTAAFCRPLMT